MSDEPIPAETAEAGDEAAGPERTEVRLEYAGVSGLLASEGKATLALAGNVRRDPVRLEATVKDPLKFREALSALHAVVSRDDRYVPRTAPRTSPTAVSRASRPTSARGRRSGPTSPGCSATTRPRSSSSTR
jgi:hypothetical protein